MTDNTELLRITRQFLVTHNRYMASSTQGRLKEMQVAQKDLEAELAKYPTPEPKQIQNKITGLF